MGKVPPVIYTDSDNEAGVCTKNKKKRSKSLKERFRGRSKSEPEGTWRSARSRCSSRSSGATSRSSSRSSPARPKLRGILKHTERERASPDEDDEDDEEDEEPSEQTRGRCLVGRVPPRAGAKPGRGGGLALVIRRNPINVLSTSTGRSVPNKSSFKRLTRKQSY